MSFGKKEKEEEKHDIIPSKAYLSDFAKKVKWLLSRPVGPKQPKA